MKKTFKTIAAILTVIMTFASMFTLAGCGHKHTPGDPARKDDHPATCTEDGSYYEVITCTECGEELSSTLKTEEALGHNRSGEKVREKVTAPTCTKPGSYDEVLYCVDCDVELSRDKKTSEPTDHTADELVKENDEPSTCSKKGSYDEVVYCKTCGDEITRTQKFVEMLPHDYADTYTSDASGHWYKCKNCTNKKNFEPHTPGPEATEATAQKCKVCDYTITPPIGHVHAEHLTPVPAVSADCETPGNILYYVCECGEWYENESATLKIDNHDDVVIPATGHNVDTNWTYNETHHYHAALCGREAAATDKTEHTFDGGVITGNVKKYSCTVCDYYYTHKTYTVTFDYNYTGSPEAVEVAVEEGDTASRPDGFFRDGYKITGWYTNPECTEAYDFESAVTSNIRIYPTYSDKRDRAEKIIEAEYINLAGIQGNGYSNSTRGTGLIQKDANSAAGASNGFFVGYLYRRDLTLTFEVYSDEETNSATLKLSLSSEITDAKGVSVFTLKSDEFTVKVNNESISYNDIVIDGVSGSDVDKEEKRAFQDFVISTNVHLVKGKNIIKLIVSNGKKPYVGGTMNATAPLVDCLKIESNTVVTYDPILENLKNK